ncbi:MAG: hypothetical protein LW860_07555 [Xanthomonadaceae bacterium]|jgi:hypothetical protein|nr:hypothetical protein [Xanthomonadaceae bacterium]
MWLLLRIILVCAIAWLAWATLLFVPQRALMYPGANLRAPAIALPPAAERIVLQSSGMPGHAILLRADTTGRSPAILFAHGNAEFAAQNAAAFQPWADAGLHVLLVEYPGYDGAAGAPTQASIDALWITAYDWLASRSDVDPRRIIGFGRSLGSGPTSMLSSRRPLAAVVLQSPFASTARFAHERGLPGFLVRDRWDNAAALRSFGGPVFVSHGRHDTIIRPSHAVAIAGAPNVELEWLECGHNDCPWFETAYRDRVLGFLAAKGVLAD